MYDEKTLIELLERKKSYMIAMRRITEERLNSKDDIEKDAENYIKLVDAREEIIDKLKGFDTEIERITKELPETFVQSDTVTALKQEIRQLAEQTIAAERELRKRTQGYLEHFGRKLKELKDRKHVSNAYNNDNFNSEGYYMDKKH